MKAFVRWISLVTGISAGIAAFNEGEAALNKRAPVKRVAKKFTAKKSYSKKAKIKKAPARALVARPKVQPAAQVPAPVQQMQTIQPALAAQDSDIQPSIISDVQAQKTGTPDLEQDFARLNAMEGRYAEGSNQQYRLKQSTSRIVRKLEARKRASQE